MGDNNNNCAGNEGCLARTRNRFHNLAYYLGINPRTARNQRKHNKELEREAKFTTPEATAARARAWEAQRLQAEQNAREGQTGIDGMQKEQKQENYNGNDLVMMQPLNMFLDYPIFILLEIINNILSLQDTYKINF